MKFDRAYLLFINLSARLFGAMALLVGIFTLVCLECANAFKADRRMYIGTLKRSLACLAWCMFASAVMGASADKESQYLVTRQEDDPQFIIAIVRTGPCKLPGSPLTASQVRVPWQLYPSESVQRHEEGTVKMKLTLDSDSCVSKATILQSSGFWRLDEVSLRFVMTLKIAPKVTILEEGRPTIIFPIAWGASQRRH